MNCINVCDLRKEYYCWNCPKLTIKTERNNIMALNLNGNTVSAKANGIDLTSIEALLVERFKSVIAGNNNNNQSILVLSTEVKELRNEVKKLIEETKQLNAAFVLAAKVSSVSEDKMKAFVEKKTETPKASDNSKLIAEIKAAKDVDELRAIKKAHNCFEGMLTPRGHKGMYGEAKLNEIKEKMLSLCGNGTATVKPIEKTETQAPIANIESWSKALKVGQDQLRTIVDSIRSAKDLLCKSDFEEIREFLGKEALPNPFINWLESVQRSARK
jgi:hypothetical protein